MIFYRNRKLTALLQAKKCSNVKKNFIDELLCLAVLPFF